MGKIADLINQEMPDLQNNKAVRLADDKPVTNEKERFEAIQALAESYEAVEIWASREMEISFKDDIVKLKKGKNSVSPIFAVFAIGKYGLDNRYGLLSEQYDMWIHDEPFGDLTKKTAQTKPEKPETKEA